MRAPRPGTGNQDEAVEFFRADERERRPVSARNGAVCGSVKGYLDTASTSSEHPTWARHVPGSGLRTSARGHGSGGAPQTHELDHESPPGPRRPTESSPSSPGRSSSASDHRASRLSAGTSRSRAAVRRLAAGLLLLVAGLAAGPAAAQTSITQTADGATWTLTGHTSAAAGSTYTYTLTLTSGTKPLNEYGGFHLPNTADNQDKLGTDPTDCTAPKQFCISFSGGSSGDGIWDNVQGHDTRHNLLSATSPYTLTATFAVAADAPVGSTIEFGAIKSNGLPRDDGLTITVVALPPLVSNTGQGNSGAVGIGVSDFAQAFGTGSNTAGYDLASIVLSLGNAPTGTGTLTVTVREDASGDPSGTALYTLTTPDPIVEDDLNTFPAPAGATLDANTTYWVVASYSAGTGTPNWWRVNLSDGIDSGGAAGWTIDSPYKQDSRTAPDGWTVGSSSRGLKLQVKGTAKGGTILSSDATLTDLALSGVTLDPTFVSTTETYTATVGNSVTETTVTATRTHSGATVAFKDGDDNALTNPVTLDVGDNVIKAVVTAEDLTAMKTYMVTVTREAATTTVPGAPTGLTATASGTTTIDLTWDAPSSDGGSAITGYRIEVSSDGGSSWTDREADTGTTNTTYAHTGLSAGTTRHYRVSAINSVGTGAASGTANATTETAVVTPTETEVAADWDLKPSGLSGGDKFRLLFITSTSRNAVPTAIADYNTFVQNRAAAGHSEIQTHSSGFRAVGSTEDVDARDNTSTTYTSSDKGVPIYWLDGNKVVDDYEDFYDGDWDEETTLKNESGNTVTTTGSITVWTGSNHDGTEATAFGFSNALGKNPARTGKPGTSTTAGPLTSTGTVANVANTETRRMYGLSSVFVVEDGPTLSTDATLSALELSGVTLAPTFVSSTETYTATVGNSVMQTTVTATTTHSGATVAFKDGDDNPLTNPVTLDVGDNVIKAVVTAEDLTAMKTYIVTVTREGPTDTPVTIEAQYESIGAGLEDLLFTLTREGETTEALDVKVTIDQAQSWLSNIEYTVTFPADEATAELTITASNFSFTPSTTGDLTATVTGDGIDGGSDTVEIISTSGPPIAISYDMSEYTFAENATDAAIYALATLDAAYPREPGPSIVVTIVFSSRSGTAVSPEDYASISRNVTFRGSDFERVDTDPLVARKAIPGFAIENDDIYEGSESFEMWIEWTPGLSADLVQFVNPDGTMCVGSGCVAAYTVTITDVGDLPVLSLSVDPSSIAEEDDAGTTSFAENVSTVTVEITNDKTFAGDVTATLTFSGTATQGTHYSVSPGDADTGTPGHQVVLVKETASVEVTVTATGNDTADGPRTVTVTGALGSKGIGTGDITILDDETTTTQPAIESKNLVEMSEGNTASLGVTLSIAPTSDLTVGITSDDIGAVTVNPSSLTFTSANWDDEQSLDISAVKDSDGDNEDVMLTLSGTGLTSKTVTVTVTDNDNPPGAPTSLTATADGQSQIDLSWTAPSDGGSVITGYKIEVSSDDGASWANLEGGNTGNTNTTYSHTSLSAGTTRHYRVSAINSVGTGAASSTVSATTTTLSTDATLSALTVNDGTTDHTIDLATTPYTLNVGNAVTTVTLTATPTHTGASVSAVTLGGTAIADTDFTDGITVPSLVEGDNVIVVTVTAQDGSTTEPYTVTVTRAGTTTTTAPAIIAGGVQVTSTPMATVDTYGPDETIAITVTFDNAVTVGTFGGTPRIQFRLGPPRTDKWAEYSSGSGGTALVFTYTVQSGDMDDDGIWLPENFLELQSGTISAAADNTVDATLTYAEPGLQSVHKVNGSYTTTDATLSALALSGVTLDPTFVSSTETYTATVGNSVMQTTVTATPTHPGATVAVKDGDDNALTNPVTLAVGDNVIKAVVTAPDATTMKTYMVTVTRGATVMPAIVTDGVQVTSTPKATVDTYGRGETIEITVTFDNAVTVGTSGGTPRIAFFLDGVLIRWAKYSSGSGGTALVFTYTVLADDMDDDGIRLDEDLLKLQGGTISSAADNTVDATLTYADPGLQSGHKVDGSIVDGSTVPGAPTSLTARASGTTTINLSWTEPSNNGGSPITGYKIEVSSNGGANWTDRVADTGTTTTSYSHTGLSAGTTRHYRVSAINANGTGAVSNIDDATTDDAATTVPDAPTSLTATASGSTRIDLDWTAPADDGGASISGYRIEVSPNGTSSWTDRVADTGTTTTTYSHTGLSAGTTRHYRVSAINANGTGAVSNIDDATTDDAATTVPGAPTSLTATASGSTRIDLDWDAPSNDGGASISGYRIEISPNGTSSWTNRVGNTGSTSTSYSHTGLDAGTTRHYRVSAINSAGTGTASSTANATTEDAATTVPGAPTGLTATASGSTRIDLDWDAPSNDGGASISGYKIEVSPNGTSSWTNRVGNTGSTSTSYSHTGLDAGTTRHYRVSAINSAGTGTASSTANATTEDDDGPDLAVVTMHALRVEGGTARFELLRTGGDMDWLKVSYRHDESDGNYVRSWGYFKPGVTVKAADYDFGSSGRVTARVTGPSDPLCTGDPVNDSSSCTDDYEIGNPSSASMQVTASASSSDDALEDALTLVDGLTPDVAAAVLLGERTLGEAELAALDRLGNGNGRYDLGDLLSWIERCRRGEAHCGRTSTDSGPAAAALLGGAVAGGRSTPGRPGRRGSGRRGRKPTRTARRRGRFAGYALATLFAATLTLSCTEGSVGPAAYVPDPGFLTVEWSGPAAHRDVGVLLEFEGPTIDAVRAPGFELYESSASGRHRIVVAGSLRPGPFVEFRVPDRGQLPLYSVRVLEVTGEGYGLRDPTEYRAVVVMN